MNVYDYLLACADFSQVAIISRREIVTYGELRATAERVACALHSAGITPGARVGILGENSAFWVASYLGILKLGAVAVPFPARLSGDKLDALASLTACAAICMDERRARQYAARLGEQCAIVTPEHVLGDAAIGVLGASLPGRGAPETHGVTEHIDLAALMFTSGSTGEPNAVKVSHRNIMANADAIVEYLDLAADDRIMVLLPFDYCFGLSLLHTHLHVGGSLALNNASHLVEDVLNDLERFACTGLAGVPAIYQNLLRRSSFARRTYPQLRHAQQAGGKLPNSLITEFLTAQPHVRFFVMYGQTEATSRLSYLPPERLVDKLGSIGKGIPGTRLYVLDERGAPVLPGEVGEIVAEGDSVTLGYLIPDPAKDSFRDGRLYTGDQGQVDEDGFIFVVGRMSDFIKPNGHRISVKEIEDTLCEMREIVEAAVVGIPDPDLGEAARAFIVLRAGCEVSHKQIVEHCKGRLPSYAIPREVTFLTELPKSGSQKVLKRALLSS
jgi:acyl-CoA synthetase (AMP-forming)/AMP-acid ligase II